MWPTWNSDKFFAKKLIQISPIDPSGLNSLTTAAKAGNAIISGATIAQAWSIVNLKNELGQPPMTPIGDALVCVVGSQPWIVFRFITTVQTVTATGIIQALSYANYFQETIVVA